MAVMWGFMHPVGVVAANDPLPEYTVKAGYLYNFALLTEWPPGSMEGDLELCFFGSSDAFAFLDTLQGKSINKRHIALRAITGSHEVQGCHLLYIAESEKVAAIRLMRDIAGLPMLSVTDDERVAKTGAIIFLRPERQRLVFEINIDAAKAANLGLSARLLRLARSR